MREKTKLKLAEPSAFTLMAGLGYSRRGWLLTTLILVPLLIR